MLKKKLRLLLGNRGAGSGAGVARHPVTRTERGRWDNSLLVAGHGPAELQLVTSPATQWESSAPRSTLHMSQLPQPFLGHPHHQPRMQNTLTTARENQSLNPDAHYGLTTASDHSLWQNQIKSFSWMEQQSV